MLKVLLLIFAAQLSFGAACPKTGSTYYCDNASTESANRTAFVDTMAAIDCGETLVLKANTEIKTANTTMSGYAQNGTSFGLTNKTTAACQTGKYITIKSSRADELPQGVRVSPADAAKMARLVVTHAYPLIVTYANAHHYKLEGIHFTNDPSMDSGCTATPTVTACTMGTYLIGADTYAPEASPNNLIFDRCLCAPYNPNVKFGSVLGCAQIEAREVTFKNSYIYGFSGWLVNSFNGLNPFQHTVTSVSSGTAPVVTFSPGSATLASKYVWEFGGFTGDYAVLNGTQVMVPTSSTTGTTPSVSARIVNIIAGSDPKTVQVTTQWPHPFETGHSVTIAMAGGGTSSLSCLSGQTVTLTKVNANRVSFTISGCASSAYYFDASDDDNVALQINTTGFSTGSLGWVRAVEKGNYYGLFTVGGPGPITLENNYIQAQFAHFFTGGGGSGASAKAAHVATIASVDTPNTVFTLSHVNGLSVNDMIAMYNSGGQPCQGKVTAINGKQITTAGVGTFRPSNGCTFSVGGSVRWRGYPIEGLKIVRNTFETLQDTQIMGHKGAIEVKTGKDWLVLGNKFIGEDDSPQLFMTVRNDAANSQGVWATAEGIHFISNITQVGTSNIAPVDDQGGIQTQRRIGDRYNPNVFRNNLHFQAMGRPFTTIRFGSIIAEHNTYIPTGVTMRGDYLTTINAITSGQECGAYPNGVRPFIWSSNIVSYGFYGFSGASDCWDLTKRGNVYIDQYSQNPYWENAPNNQVAANVAALGLAGTCDVVGENWKNCYLGGGSTYKGDGDDGKDPGVDMEELVDDQSGWSVRAGLVIEDAITKKTKNPAAWKIGSTRVAITANRIAGGTCTFILYTNAARTTQHGDTDSAPEQDCARTGNTSSPGTVTLVLGTNTALTASTTYYYKLTMGSAVMVGEFATTAAGSGIAASWNRARECGTDGSTFGTAVSANTPYSVASGSVRYCRAAVGEPVEVLVAP